MALYHEDLAHIHASGFTSLAEAAGRAIPGRLRAAGIEGGLVVDLGCGNGLTSRALAGAGYEVLGIDSSEAMLRIARRSAPGVRFLRASFLDVSLPGCRAVVAAGEVLNYTERSLMPVFRRVRAAIEPGGLFVLDLAGPGRVPGGGPVRSWWEDDDWAVLVETREDRERALLTRRMTTFRRTGRTWRRGEETHRQRLHRPSEAAGRLRALGFTVRIRRGYEGERLAPGHYVLIAQGVRPHPRGGMGSDPLRR